MSRIHYTTEVFEGHRIAYGNLERHVELLDTRILIATSPPVTTRFLTIVLDSFLSRRNDILSTIMIPRLHLQNRHWIYKLGSEIQRFLDVERIFSLATIFISYSRTFQTLPLCREAAKPRTRATYLLPRPANGRKTTLSMQNRTVHERSIDHLRFVSYPSGDSFHIRGLYGLYVVDRCGRVQTKTSQ